MAPTARELNRATLDRQLLLERESLAVAEAVRRLVAVQAQSPASPYIGLWNRLAGFDPADLDAAFADGTVVKANTVRMTLHATHADDFVPFREALMPSLRAATLGNRFPVSGLTASEADSLVPELLAFARQPRTAVECERWLASRVTGQEELSAAWWALRQYAPLLRAPTGGPWAFGPRISYVAPRTLPVQADPDVSAQAVRTLFRRYLLGFGPASVADLAQFAGVQRRRAKAAAQALEGELEQLAGPTGEVLYDLPGAPRPTTDTPAPPRLMAMWDSVLLAYADRSRIIPPEHRKHVIRVNGDVLATLLVDGYVAGVWRPVDGGIEATAFHRLSPEAWEGLASEARGLVPLLSRDPRAYRRYDSWWRTLPQGEVRLLGAE